MNKTAKKYLRDVARRLPVFNKNTHRLIGNLKNSIENFLEVNEDPSYADLEIKFGTPESIYQNFKFEYSNKVDAYYRLSISLKLIIVLILVVALLLISIIAIQVTIDNAKSPVYYYETSISEEVIE